MDDQKRFEIWQQSECRWLGCTVEQHNRLLEIADRMAVTGFGGYYSLVAVVKASNSVREAGQAMIRIAEVMRRMSPAQPQPVKPRGRGYLSKKLRRIC